MQDLISTYRPENTKELKELLLKRFADVNIDEISPLKLWVSLPDEQKDEFLIFALKEGFGYMSFTIKMMACESTKMQERLNQLVRNAKLELLQEEKNVALKIEATNQNGNSP